MRDKAPNRHAEGRGGERMKKVEREPTNGVIYEDDKIVKNGFRVVCRTARKKQARRHWCRVNGMSRK